MNIMKCDLSPNHVLKKQLLSPFSCAHMCLYLGYLLEHKNPAVAMSSKKQTKELLSFVFILDFYN